MLDASWLNIVLQIIVIEIMNIKVTYEKLHFASESFSRQETISKLVDLVRLI
jgi:hypothetical protein